MFKLIVTFIFMVFSYSAVSAELPKELWGDYDKGADACGKAYKMWKNKEMDAYGGVILEKDEISYSEIDCKAKKVTGSNGNYKVTMECTRWDEEDWKKYNTSFAFKDNKLTITGGMNGSEVWKKCTVEKTAPPKKVTQVQKKEEQCLFKSNEAKIYRDSNGTLDEFSKSGSTVGLGDTVIVIKRENAKTGKYIHANVLDGRGGEYLSKVYILEKDLDCGMY